MKGTSLSYTDDEGTVLVIALDVRSQQTGNAAEEDVTNALAGFDYEVLLYQMVGIGGIFSGATDMKVTIG